MSEEDREKGGYLFQMLPNSKSNFWYLFFTDGGSPRLTMLNGKYYERKNEEIDKVVIHKKRRRLSESPNDRKSTPPVGISEAKVTVSKRVSTESNASSGEPRSGQSSGSNSPKNYSQIKRKKRKLIKDRHFTFT